MRYLIDGYNLLHAMGVLSGRAGPQGLEKARLRLLGLLHGAHGTESSQVTVVFDAAHAPPGAKAETEYQGIQVLFAVGQAQADDLIEQTIARASAPKALAVVSDDHRIQQAGRRRHCRVCSCAEYLDHLERKRRAPPKAPRKPEATSSEDLQHWLKEFGDLEHDPDWKELADPPEFREE